MIKLPLKAFCLMGSNGVEKIEIIINEVFDFPERTSFEGGYDFKGELNICVESYEVHSKDFFSSTGILYTLLVSLTSCYSSLQGIAEYKRLYEDDFAFTLRMGKTGHAMIERTFQEYPHLSNKLTFQMETDQTCILSAISELKQVERLFGNNKGYCI